MTTYIPKEEWKKELNGANKEAIKKHLHAGVDAGFIKFPLKTPTKIEALHDFANLCELDCKTLVKESDEIVTRYPYRYQLSKTYIDNCRVGNNASAYFSNEERYTCDSINSPSPVRTWITPKFRDSLFNALWSLKVDEVSDKTLSTCFALRKYIASQFRPSAAKALYQHFGAKSVLDFSMGWGDRLTGFLSTNETNFYRGLDPNVNMHKRYNQIANEYNMNHKMLAISDECAEEAYYVDGLYDLAFTSPPYYNIERYSKDNTQSWVRYKNDKEWLEKFLFESIKRAYKGLNKNGRLCINISDVYSNHCVHSLCDPMNDFIASLGATYEGTIGYRMAKRVNSKSDKAGIFVEPIWIWRKT